jgi:hypothetical protein
MNDSTIRSVSKPPGEPTRYPLHVTLAAVFVTAFVVFGVAVIAYGYVEGRRTELISARGQMDRIGRQIRIDIAKLYRPAQALVDIASKSALWQGDTIDQRLLALPAVCEAFELQPSISHSTMWNPLSPQSASHRRRTLPSPTASGCPTKSSSGNNTSRRPSCRRRSG